MSEFVYCLNTSTIRPTPLLEKIGSPARPATRRSSPGTTRSPPISSREAAVAELKRALAGAGLPRRQRHRAARLDHRRGSRVPTRPRRLPPPDGPGRGAGEPVHRGQSAAGGGGPGPRLRTIRRADRARQAGRRDPLDGVPRVRRRDQERRECLGDRVRDRRSRGDGRGRRLPHDPRRRLASTTCSSSRATASPVSTSTTCRPSPTR